MTSELDVLPELLGFNLRRLQLKVAESWRNAFESIGLVITPVQGGALLLIDRHGVTSQRQLATLLSVEPPSMQQVLAPLIERGYVQRGRTARDGRVVELVLSEKGEAAVALIRARVRQAERIALGPLSDDEADRLLHLLRKAASSAES